MRYCGNCGASFDPAALVDRVCPSCGAPINRTGDILPDVVLDVTQEPTRHLAGGSDAMSLSSLPTPPGHSYTDTQTHIAPSWRISGKLPVLLALIALALLLVFGSEILLSNAPGSIHLPGLAVGGGNAQSTSMPSASRAAATSGAQLGPPSTPGGSPSAGTPTGGTPAVGTVTPDATGTTTPAAGQPALAVAPTTVSNLVCLGASTKFTVTNSGSGVMTWSATGSRSAYKLSPQSGSLGSGQQQTVTVSGISASGKVTFTAPGAANSPQVVSINCML